MVLVRKIDINGIEFLHSNSLGTAPRTRVERGVREGFLVFDRGLGDYIFTKKVMSYKNFWNWLQGTEENLYSYEDIF